tara:strand:- start:13 stop:1329 length:1317 start_codon:yes stop_codon:yes gene_type:complete
MRKISFGLLEGKSIYNYGFLFFLLGVFFLPSTIFLGILFLIPALLISSFFLHKKNYFKDYWNYPYLFFGILILLSAILQNFILSNNYFEIWDPNLSLIGLANWIPFIWIFWAVQPYLNSNPKRRTFSITLIIGTFPVLVSGFGQYFFNWNGPFETLNGLIIWYQRPIENPGGLSGLFSNQNYAGSWLNFVWPFCLALILEKGNNIFRKTAAFSFLISTGVAAFLTFSRNAWLGLITSLPIVTGKKGVKFFLPLVTIAVMILFFAFSPIFNGELQNNLRNLFPQKIFLEFNDQGYQGLDVTRLEIYKSALNLIKENPIFGTGAASFPNVFFLETNFWKGHSHNLLLELSISYGLPSAFCFFIVTSNILYLSSKKIFINQKVSNLKLFDRAIWSALFFFLLSQLADIQYFDGKISLITWILIASLKLIILENGKEKLDKQ